MQDQTDARRLLDRNDRILDAGALRALAHPLRVQIYDILSQYGPQTASSLASLTGESSGATSYHLRALAKHDLIREVDGRGTARERWWERPVGGVSFANPEAMKTPSGRAATQVVMTEFLNRRHQQLMQYAARGLQSEPEDWQDGSLISTANARLTSAQMQELAEKLQALLDETVGKYRDQRGEGVRPVTMHVDVFPLPEEGAHR
ncbi:winged helix-turn-helix domain-containing protein [Microbacterium rhizomatis]|uniref:Helix-turn-helix transcriptional regulator n=1 Tax=Microbacterium rhizomatis TaxID=1631477 RepID=A0A5J5J6L1_9MICO|nr:helix-turn-helix domain-containing protein [Microbacterium rhizomatis]KAA9110423.1 helix-turn-helix transcriptional regulator [Microbacterium rhizomatis]